MNSTRYRKGGVMAESRGRRKSNGEWQDVYSSVKVFSKVVSVYVRVYVEAQLLMDCLTASEHFIIGFLAGRVDFNTNVCTLETNMRKSLREHIGLSEPALAAALKGLIDKGFLVRIGRGMFIVNPRVYFKGEDKARDKMLKEGDWWLHGEARKEVKPDGPVEPKREKRKKAIQPNEQF